MASTTQLYAKILERFPQKNLRFAFAYGSGVFKQLQNSNDAGKNMIDFVLVVDNEIRFHDENLRTNGKDYSFLKWLGPYYLSRIQNEFGAACYYNTLVPVRVDSGQQLLIKYGVISEQALTRDLFDWDYLYVSGRLQKPVKIVKPHSNDDKKTATASTASTATTTATKQTVMDTSKYKSPLYTTSSSFQQALHTNLKNALHTALLLMPSKFTLQELFVCITTLSYMGDFRMVIGENKQKCTNIVLPQMDRFLDLYKPYLIRASVENVLKCDLESGKIEQTLSPDIVYHHLSQLPKNLLKTIVKLNYKDDHYYDLEEYIYKLTSRVDYKQMVAQGVSEIVKRSATAQSAKGVLTAGVGKSLKYSWRKLEKMMK